LSERWPAAGSGTPKAADLPACEERTEEHPSLSLLPSPGHAAAEPGDRPDAGQVTAPRGGLDARYEQLRHAALHARAEAFPPGLGVLASKGVTAWRHALASLTPVPSTCQPPGTSAARAADLPAAVATELINARKDESQPRYFPNWLRQRVEAIIWTLKNQLGLERHGGRVPAGLWARITQRLLALNAAIWFNWQIGAPVKRSLIAYDH
jgi:hypothetical protein